MATTITITVEEGVITVQAPQQRSGPDDKEDGDYLDRSIPAMTTQLADAAERIADLESQLAARIEGKAPNQGEIDAQMQETYIPPLAEQLRDDTKQRNFADDRAVCEAASKKEDWKYDYSDALAFADEAQRGWPAALDEIEEQAREIARLRAKLSAAMLIADQRAANEEG